MPPSPPPHPPPHAIGAAILKSGPRRVRPTRPSHRGTLLPASGVHAHLHLTSAPSSRHVVARVRGGVHPGTGLTHRLQLPTLLLSVLPPYFAFSPFLSKHRPPRLDRWSRPLARMLRSATCSRLCSSPTYSLCSLPAARPRQWSAPPPQLARLRPWLRKQRRPMPPREMGRRRGPSCC
uniref:Uncharacterized protein n=1 Tax=Zea mays TaxID=4577 RepID=A0A804RJ03_MAIZE